MAYDIIKKLKENKAVETKRKANNKKHEVWELSFDWKHCSSDQFVQQKIDYIPARPVRRAYQPM